MAESEISEKLQRDYLFADCRLGDHPNVRVEVLWRGEDTDRLSGVVAEELIIGDMGGVPSYTALASYPSRRSALVTALKLKDEEVGAVVLYSPEKGFFRTEHTPSAMLFGKLLVFAKLHLEKGLHDTSLPSIELGQAMREVRKSRGLSQAEVAGVIGQGRLSLSRWETGHQPPSKGPFYSWCEGLELVSDRTAVLVSSVDITPQMLEALKEDPRRLSQLSPEALERFVAERLDRMGYVVNLTGATCRKDGGVDLLAVPKTPALGSVLLACQVKHHSGGQKTGRAAVDRLLAWKGSPFNLGLLVTNTGFTKDALWVAAQEANKGFLRLRDFEDLKRWIEGNLWSPEEWREIPEVVELAPGITVPVPKPDFSPLMAVWPNSQVTIR